MVIEKQLFSTLNMMPNANYLMNTIETLQSKHNFFVTFLSSGADASGKVHFEEAFRQKKN